MIDVEIQDGSWTVALEQAEAIVERAAEAALSEIAPTDLQEPVIAVLLTDDDTVADLNQRFRGKDGPTNVLSWRP
jgi:probable rRNA maturation factor